MANNFQILSFKTLHFSTLVLFTALLLNLTKAVIPEFVTSVAPQVWSALLSLLRRACVFLIINAIIIAIAVSYGLHHKDQDPRETRQDPGVLDADTCRPPQVEEEEETSSFGVKVVDPSMLHQDPTEIRPGPKVLAATAYGENEEEIFADCRSDCVRERKEPMGAVRVGNRESMKTSCQGRKALEMMRPKSNETFESVWKRIMESRPVPQAHHLNESNEYDTSFHPQSDTMSIQRSSLLPILNFQKLKKPFPRQPTLSSDELNQQVETFIKKFNEQMRQQRQDIESE